MDAQEVQNNLFNFAPNDADETHHVLGPVRVLEEQPGGEKVMNICDEGKFLDNEQAVAEFEVVADKRKQCTKEWLRGRTLNGVGLRRIQDDAECQCFVRSFVDIPSAAYPRTINLSALRSVLN
mmetsp:Transcript_27255/g.65887  ORF Transcript_27255/g.65887 Transcript_27255/m.65887 type:complete len:123 (-) Transcript_27255:822-1190(-)